MSTIAALRALLALDNSDYLEGLTSSQSAADGFGTKLSAVGGAVVVGSIAAAGAAITAVGAAAWDAGNTMDEAMDKIATATGAGGPELGALKGDFEAVFKSVPTDAGTAADAIGILNSQLDITGPFLQDLAKPLLEVSRITGGDASANAEGFAKVIQAWGLPLEDASTSLDALFVASQKTGVPLESLIQDAQTSGPIMRAMGLSFTDSAALMATWESKGVDTGKMISGLRIAAGNFTKQNIPMKQGLEDTVKAIEGAANQTDAMNIAMKVFGAKGAVDMVEAIRAGTFNIDDLTAAMDNADGAIMDTAASTMDWGEKWTMFKNKVTVALAPIGATMMEGVGTAMDSVVAIFERPDIQASLNTFVTMIGSLITQAVAYIPTLINGFMSFITFLQNNQGIVVGILAALGVAALAWGVTTAAAAITAMAPFLPIIAVLALIGAAAYLLYEAWTNNWGGIRDTLTGAWAALQPAFEAIKQYLSVAIPAALAIVKMWWDGFITTLQTVWSFISTYILPLFTAIANVIGAVLGLAIRAAAGYFQNVLLPPIRAIWDFISKYVIPIIQTLASWLSSKLAPAFDGIKNAILGVIGFLKTLADKINSISLPDWLTPGSPTPFEIGLLGIAAALNEVNQAGFMPDLASGNLSAPTSAAALANGGSTGPTNKTVNYNIQIHNPKGENTEESTRKSLKKLSFLGVAE